MASRPCGAPVRGLDPRRAPSCGPSPLAAAFPSANVHCCRAASPAPRAAPPACTAGGDQIRILNWVFRRGALATQADYPYQVRTPPLPALPHALLAMSGRQRRLLKCSSPVRSCSQLRSGSVRPGVVRPYSSGAPSRTRRCVLSRRAGHQQLLPHRREAEALQGWALPRRRARSTCPACLRARRQVPGIWPALCPLPLRQRGPSGPGLRALPHPPCSRCRPLGACGGRGGAVEGGAADQGAPGRLK